MQGRDILLVSVVDRRLAGLDERVDGSDIASLSGRMDRRLQVGRRARHVRWESTVGVTARP
jgi:hypothetical protein